MNIPSLQTLSMVIGRLQSRGRMRVAQSGYTEHDLHVTRLEYVDADGDVTCESITLSCPSV